MSHAEDMSNRRERQLATVTANQQMYAAPQSDDWLDAVSRQVCPFCGAGPFTVLATHVNRIHGINKREFRDMLGLTFGESICDPHHAQACAVRSRAKYRPGVLVRPVGIKNELSHRGRASQKLKASNLTPEIRRRVGSDLSDRLRRENAERDDAIMAAVAMSERYTDIAKRFGVATTTVRAVAQRNGVSDGRGSYWESRKGTYSDNLRRGAETRSERERERRAVLRRRFEEGEDLRHMAEELQITLKSLIGLLVKAGAVVPDQRATKPVETVECVCPTCGKKWEMLRSLLERKKRTAVRSVGPFCTVSCSRRFQRDDSR